MRRNQVRAGWRERRHDLVIPSAAYLPFSTILDFVLCTKIKVDSDIGDDVDEDARVNFVSKLGCLLTTFGRGVPFGRVSNLGGCQTNSAGCHTPQNRTDCDIFNFLPIISHNNHLTTPSALAMHANRHFGCSLFLNPSKMVISMPSCHN